MHIHKNTHGTHKQGGQQYIVLVMNTDRWGMRERWGETVKTNTKAATVRINKDEWQSHERRLVAQFNTSEVSGATKRESRKLGKDTWIQQETFCQFSGIVAKS